MDGATETSDRGCGNPVGRSLLFLRRKDRAENNLRRIPGWTAENLEARYRSRQPDHTIRPRYRTTGIDGMCLESPTLDDGELASRYPDGQHAGNSSRWDRGPEQRR
jgi:hypothetical protein